VAIVAGESIVDRLLGLVGITRASDPALPAVQAEPSATSVLTDLTVASLRAMLREHDQGYFHRSALLAEQVLREPDLFGALTQRLEALFALETCVEPYDDSDAAKAEAEAVEELLGIIMPSAVQREMLSSVVLLGFAVGQLRWHWHEQLGQLVPRLYPWPSSQVEYREHEGRWYAHTNEGPALVTPGDGQWVLYAPRSLNRPQIWGVIRCVAEWYLRTQLAGGDASKSSEIHGVPVWLAELPSGSITTTVGQAFLRSIRNMGRNAVVPLAQGNDKATSYNLRLEQPATDTHKIFEFLLRTGGGKFRLAILGQDLTAQNNQVGTNASSETGAQVTRNVTASDATSWSECLQQQVFVPLAWYRGTQAIAPEFEIDAEEEEDFEQVATAIKTAGEALLTWQSAGWEVDLEAFAQRFGVPGKAKPPPATPAPTTAPTVTPQNDSENAA